MTEKTQTTLDDEMFTTVTELRSLNPGDTLGCYTVVERLPSGGFGDVWLAHDPHNAAVVLKRQVSQPLRFSHEYKALQRLNDSAITPRAIAEGLEDPVPWIVMEFVEAPTLREFVRNHGPLKGDLLMKWAEHLQTAISELNHTYGILHRDLSPGNVCVLPDGVRILDLGVARGTETAPMTVAGSHPPYTPRFSAPEITIIGSDHKAADVWSWGALVLFAATGRTLSLDLGDNPVAAALANASCPPTVEDFPPTLRTAVACALIADPAARRMIDVRGCIAPFGADAVTDFLTRLPAGSTWMMTWGDADRYMQGTVDEDVLSIEHVSNEYIDDARRRLAPLDEVWLTSQGWSVSYEDAAGNWLIRHPVTSADRASASIVSVLTFVDHAHNLSEVEVSALVPDEESEEHATDELDRALSRSLRRMGAALVDDRHVELFVVRRDGELVGRWFDLIGDGGWSAPETHGLPAGMVVIDCAVTSQGSDHEELFVLDDRGKIWHKWWNPDDLWSAWHPMEAEQVAYPPLAAHRREVFATDRYGHIIHRWLDHNHQWTDWNSYVEANPGEGTAAESPPHKMGAALVDDRHVELFVVRRDGELVGRWFDLIGDGGWSAPETHGLPAGMVVIDCAVTSQGSDHEELFVLDDRGKIWHKWWNPDDLWSAWHPMEAEQVAYPPLAAHRREVFATDRYGHIIHRWLDHNHQWTDWNSYVETDGTE